MPENLAPDDAWHATGPLGAPGRLEGAVASLRDSLRLLLDRIMDVELAVRPLAARIRANELLKQIAAAHAAGKAVPDREPTIGALYEASGAVSLADPASAAEVAAATDKAQAALHRAGADLAG
jgi:hypothetical protein